MPDSDTLDRTRAGALVDTWLRLWNGDLDAAHEIISPQNRVHAALFDGGDGSAVGGVGGMQSLVAQLRGIVPDLSFEVEVGPIVDAPRVVVRWVATGHYGGGVPGASAPVGTSVTFHGIDILRVDRGLVVEYWLDADTLDLMTQLRVGAA